MNGAQCSCRCIGPVARRSRGVRRGRKVAWPTRSGDNGKNRFQADRQLLRYRLSCSLLPLSSHSISSLPATDSSAPSLRHRPSFCVSFSPFHSPLRRDYVRPSRFPSLVSSRPFSLLRTPVSQTLAKPRRRQRLSCRSTRPLRFHRDGSGSFFAVIFIVSRSLTLIASVAFSTSIFNCDF